MINILIGNIKPCPVATDSKGWPDQQLNCAAKVPVLNNAKIPGSIQYPSANVYDQNGTFLETYGPADRGTSRTPVYDKEAWPLALTRVSKLLNADKPAGWNACDDHKLDCEWKCESDSLYNMKGKCFCPAGWTLNADQKSCTKGIMVYNTRFNKCLGATSEGVMPSKNADGKDTWGMGASCDIDSDDQIFTYAEGLIEHRSSGKCLSSVGKDKTPITLAKCDAANASQAWSCGTGGNIMHDDSGLMMAGSDRTALSVNTYTEDLDDVAAATGIFYQIGRGDYVDEIGRENENAGSMGTVTAICEVVASLDADANGGGAGENGDQANGCSRLSGSSALLLLLGCYGYLLNLLS